MANESYSSHGIVYVVPKCLGDTAISENVRRRKESLETLGFIVYLVEHQEGQIINACLLLWKLRRSVRHVIIRLDGTSLLDKYTLFKLVLPRHVFIWEIHGFPEECLEFSENISTRQMVWKNSFKRKVLSLLVNACIFISPELLAYARKKIFTRDAHVIPNYIKQPKAFHQPAHRFQLPFLLKKKAFVVLWGGDASLPWQATDLIQKVARKIEKHDKNILFIMTGTQYYYPSHAARNIVYLNPMPYSQFMDLISQSDVCLALYHQPKHFPFYFYPMKLIDYLSIGKPVIATNLGSITTLIDKGACGFTTDNNIMDIMQKILLIKQHRGLARQMALNARGQAMKYFSDGRALAQYRNLFQSLLW